MDNVYDTNGDKVLTCLVHGDAAFSAQGVCYEALQMEKLKGYQVGGVIHVITNNQIGFTTNSEDGRSTQYCTDLAKMQETLIIHVNGDHPEYVDYAFDLAVDYRMKFKKDVFIDILGYRKFGHNEQDNPKFTQPYMYDEISQKLPMWKEHCKDLIDEGSVPFIKLSI